MLPFNVELMDIDKVGISKLMPINSLDHYDGGTKNFHTEGLFSIETFGPVGSERRDIMFSYIDIKTSILHPIIFNRLMKLKAFYKGVIAGTAFAAWDPKARDFVQSNELEGETGYSFFLKHWKEIKHRTSKSAPRQQRIELIEKYKDIALTNKVLVIPASLRDLQVDENGREKEDEINQLYRQVLGMANTIGVKGKASEEATFDTVRYNLQMKFNEIYDYLENILTGKRGFIQNKWGKRKIFYGTRNVISSMHTGVDNFDHPNSPGVNDSIVGLYQLAKAILPKTKNFLLDGWLSEAFGTVEGKALLIDKKTLRPEYVEVDSETFDKWYSAEGIDKFINSYVNVEKRHEPVLIKGHYLALLYRGDDTFKVFRDIDELPEGFDRENVTPLTKCQLLYLCGFTEWNKTKAFVTRYPVTSKDSTYPCGTYVKTTVRGEIRWELDENWEKSERMALEFPIESIKAHVDTLSCHSSKLKQLNAD